jgi:hypothetical protein
MEVAAALLLPGATGDVVEIVMREMWRALALRLRIELSALDLVRSCSMAFAEFGSSRLRSVPAGQFSVRSHPNDG